MRKMKKSVIWTAVLIAVALILAAVYLIGPVRENAPVATETTAAAEPMNAVRVKNADELLAAIAPDTEIILEVGTYILSEADNYGEFISEYCRWEERYDGYELTVSGVENLTLRGSGADVTVLETDPRYADVISLEYCDNVLLEDVTLGHTRDRGECGGGVINLLAVRNMTMNRLGIFGCGVVGVQADGCSGITVTDSDIYECSSSAVGLYGCKDVTIYGCRVYDIGEEAYGGYTFFDIQGSSGVFIENNRLSDSTLNNLLSVTFSNVLLKNNLFENNRPREAAFSGSNINITMEDNRFEGNTIRNWYSYEPIAKDADGKILTEADLEALYRTQAEENHQPRQEIHVSSVDEFLAAIGPDTEIILDAAVYDLSTATGYGVSESDYYCWEDIFDGPGLVIRNVSNLTIRSNDGRHTEHTIEAVPRYADVLQFRACSDITVSGFTAGHTQEQGSCTGGVLEFCDSDRITVDNCGLFGCGILGVQADNCSNVVVQNSTIYECSQGGIEMHNVDGIVIEGTSFRDIGGRYVIRLNNCKNAMVDGMEVLLKEAGTYEASTVEQEKTFALQAAVNDFANSYLYNDREYLQIYLAAGYEPEPWVSEYECLNLRWVEITYDHVKALLREGSAVFEVPFQEWNGDWVEENDLRYLRITVVEEEGRFLVSNCQEG